MKKANKPGLLDINVLIALIDPGHTFHEPAHEWFAANRQHGWATCPITENGCLRVLSSKGYPVTGLRVEQVRNIVSGLVRGKGHRFWPDSYSMLDASRFELSGAGSKNITDLYLLGLAIAFGGKLVTFERNVHWEWVTGCSASDVETI